MRINKIINFLKADNWLVIWKERSRGHNLLSHTRATSRISDSFILQMTLIVHLGNSIRFSPFTNILKSKRDKTRSYHIMPRESAWIGSDNLGKNDLILKKKKTGRGRRRLSQITGF